METAKFDRVKTLLNRDAKLSAVTREIRAMLEVSGPGDVLRIQYSGHGTRVPDKDGDEADGYDEAWVLYDGIWLDDQVADLLAELPAGVDLAVISDSCHSGTVSRAVAESPRGRPRFMPYPGAELAAAASILHRLFFGAFKPKPPAPVSAEDEAMNHALLAGASPIEYAWDASFNGEAWGAMSYHALDILNRSPHLSWEELHRRIRQRLPSTDAPQSPQLEGPAGSRLRRVAG